MTRRPLLGLLSALALGGCSPSRFGTSTVGERTPAEEGTSPSKLARFSAARPGDPIPPGWVPWTIHRSKRPTRYQLVADAGVTILQADADRSASGLINRFTLEVDVHTRLSWRWRTRTVLDDADPAVGSRDDAPVRIALAFDGDSGALPLRDRLFAERVKLLAGHDLPYATLMYIWTGAGAPDSVIQNPHTGRIRKLVIDAGDAHLGVWRTHERQIEADFRTVFGEAPGRLRAVALMTDTDNTASKARAYYGDIVLAGRA